MQRKFKVGDKVKVVSGHHIIGEICIVRDDKVSMVNCDELWYALDNSSVEDLVYNVYSGDHLQLYKVRNTKLARKMYPNHKVIDEDWICPNSK